MKELASILIAAVLAGCGDYEVRSTTYEPAPVYGPEPVVVTEPTAPEIVIEGGYRHEHRHEFREHREVHVRH